VGFGWWVSSLSNTLTFFEGISMVSTEFD